MIDSRAFSMVVVGDTQYLFDGDRTGGDYLAATFDEVAALAATGTIAPVVHAIHVGDVTEHGWPEECAVAGEVLADSAAGLGVDWTIAVGNHDIDNDSTDTRGPTPFHAAFGPGNALSGEATYSPDGYSSWRAVELPGGGQVGVLALDWRPDGGWSWARETLDAHAGMPTVVVTHDVAHQGALTAHGERVRDVLVDSAQVFLVLGGHEWPSTRVVAEREYHAVNYQQLPFGGAGAARVYDFSPATGTCQVISLCPALRSAAVLRSVAARRELALARAADQFAFDLPAALGGREPGVVWQAEGLRLVVDVAAPNRGDTVEVPPLHSEYVIEVVAQLPETMRAEWQVLLARLGPAPDGSPEPLAALSLSSENFLGWHAYLADGETWATSHEYSPRSTVRIIVGTGMWINGDPVGRVNSALGQPLAPGPTTWRIGAGSWDDAYADEFTGNIHRVRIWASVPPHRLAITT